ncbi:hypothetical protein [Haliscomenobacter hydrossis]|uniref:Uncharacterized protein n=1 Tax=Haliscomenobacter hydrossis (strain ATCC 27775 / DSM 1100 / LMG 10767 / O) TaxID=760192 RepID=F4KQZ3_HALH1|nr:hypothetical protein [Haliscomenobacter hydrossis]AEE53231.1 hypothetical protein Halhy_5406 [Haliscomenobacter hydrossis DSM 1100]
MTEFLNFITFRPYDTAPFECEERLTSIFFARGHIIYWMTPLAKKIDVIRGGLSSPADKAAGFKMVDVILPDLKYI